MATGAGRGVFVGGADVAVAVGGTRVGVKVGGNGEVGAAARVRVAVGVLVANSPATTPLLVVKSTPIKINTSKIRTAIAPISIISRGDKPAANRLRPAGLGASSAGGRNG
jgi:hypothetical protein